MVRLLIPLSASFPFTARTVLFSGTSAPSRAVTRAILGTFPGAGPVFGTIPFALSLAGTTPVTLPGTASSSLSLTSPAAAASQEVMDARILEISGHLTSRTRCKIPSVNIRSRTGT